MFIISRFSRFKFPSSTRGLFIASVTGSRGNGFGFIFAPVVGAFGAFSLFNEVDSMFEATNLTLSLKCLLHFPMAEFVQLVDWRLDWLEENPIVGLILRL